MMYGTNYERLEELWAFGEKIVAKKPILRREQVAQLRDAGLSAPQIGRELGIATNTVYSYFQQLKKVAKHDGCEILQEQK